MPLKGKIEPGLWLPAPRGQIWRDMCDGPTNPYQRRSAADGVDEVIDHMMPAMFMQETTCMRAFRGDMTKPIAKKTQKGVSKKRTRGNAVGVDQLPVPGTLPEAFRGEYSEDWVASAGVEFDGLSE